MCRYAGYIQCMLHACRSNSISSLLNQTTSFSELSAVSDEEVPDNIDIITESLQPVTTNKETIGDVVTHSTASATSLYRGAFLGRFVQDKKGKTMPTRLCTHTLKSGTRYMFMSGHP